MFINFLLLVFCRIILSLIQLVLHMNASNSNRSKIQFNVNRADLSLHPHFPFTPTGPSYSSLLPLHSLDNFLSQSHARFSCHFVETREPQHTSSCSATTFFPTNCSIQQWSIVPSFSVAWVSSSPFSVAWVSSHCRLNISPDL